MKFITEQKLVLSVLAAVASLASSSLYAVPGLVENPTPGTVFVSANDSADVPNAKIVFGQNSTLGAGGAAVNSTAIATLRTANPTLNLVYTPLNSVTPTLRNGSNGGLMIDPATGNTTVKQGTVAVDSLLSGLVRVREQEVFSNDASVAAALRGTATTTPAVTRYGTVSAAGVFTPINGLSAATVTAIENFVTASTPANAQALMTQINGNASDRALLGYTAGPSVVSPGTGNLTVEGTTITNGLNNSGKVISGVANGVASSDAVNFSQLSTETSARIAGDALLSGRITALDARVNMFEDRISSLRKGVALAAALQTPVIEQGKNNAVKMGVASVDGKEGFGIAYARRINASVQVNVDVATDFDSEIAARAGANYSF